jgi:hypothetical protein
MVARAIRSVTDLCTGQAEIRDQIYRINIAIRRRRYNDGAPPRQPIFRAAA